MGVSGKDGAVQPPKSVAFWQSWRLIVSQIGRRQFGEL